MENDKKNSDPVMDKCIFCEADTQYPITTDVSLRENYVDGAGQLCNKCAVAFYGKPAPVLY